MRSRALARIGPGDSQKPQAGHRRLVESAERHVLGDRHRRHGRVLQRLLGQAENLELVEMIALRLEVLVTNKDLPELDRPLAGQRLDELALTVAGDPGDADDFARARP